MVSRCHRPPWRSFFHLLLIKRFGRNFHVQIPRTILPRRSREGDHPQALASFTHVSFFLFFFPRSAHVSRNRRPKNRMDHEWRIRSSDVFACVQVYSLSRSSLNSLRVSDDEYKDRVSKAGLAALNKELYGRIYSCRKTLRRLLTFGSQTVVLVRLLLVYSFSSSLFSPFIFFVLPILDLLCFSLFFPRLPFPVVSLFLTRFSLATYIMPFLYPPFFPTILCMYTDESFSTSLVHRSFLSLAFSSSLFLSQKLFYSLHPFLSLSSLTHAPWLSACSH